MHRESDSIEIPAERLFEMFKRAHFIANNLENSVIDDVRYACSDLVCELAGYIEDFERKMISENKTLPYADSILENPDFEWYLLRNK